MDIEAFIEEAVEDLGSRIKGKAIVAASGGVDSTVVACIADRAIGDRLIPIYVDTGYMRKGEGDDVKGIFADLGIDLNYVEASERFYKALEGVIEPEAKRKVIGGTFIDVFTDAAGETRDTIKSHHNVGGLPEELGIDLIEPIRDLYKDEVREVAKFLKIPVHDRQPFPGPGLAIRILGEATPDRTRIVREACHITEEEILRGATEGHYEVPWQYFAVLLPVRSVGVHGDLRAYGYTIVVRAVYSLDGMTAAYCNIPHEVLDRISRRISNEMGEEVTRIVYDITNKPPSTIEWE